MAGIFGSGTKRLLTTALLGTREMDRRDLMKQKAAEVERQRLLASQGAGLFTGSPAIPAGGPVANQDGMDISAAFSPQAGRPAQAPVAQDPRAMAAALARLQGQGLDTSNFARLAEMAAPKPMNVNGVILDERDPSNIGREIAELDKGQVRVYDSERRFAGIKNADGYVQSAAELAGAVKGAEARASAPYEFVNVPTPTGAPAVTSKATAAGGTFVGQAPADAIRAEGAARGETERAQALQERAGAAGRQLAALDEMERLLPDVIAGFSSDLRLKTAKAMALAGNDEAAKKVAATETFINQGRVLVAGIIKTFGSNPTEGERKFAEKMSGADAELSPETLREGIRLQRARINRELQEAGKAPARPAASLRAIPLADRLAEARRRGLIQ